MIRVIPKKHVLRLGWTTGSFAVVQALRLVNNVALARLLAPQIFGLMLIVNTLKTGVELLSDVGINQNVVTNRRGEDRDFYDTAWSLQVLRGFLLASLCVALAVPAAHFFDEPQLAVILPVSALMFVLSGFRSTSRALLQKRMAVKRISLYEIAVLAATVAAQILLALITPTIWALVLGGITGVTLGLISSFFLIPGIRHRFIIDGSCAREILVFGKWIFLSSIIYFFAVNFDRLYFAKQITLQDLGVYAIARSLADMVSSLAARSSNMVLFPAIAAMRVSSAEVRRKVLHGRRALLAVVAVALGGFVAVSDAIVDLLYDARYDHAGLILPLLLLGVWFGVLSTVNDWILIGTGRPAYPALSNGAKLLTFVVGIPAAFHLQGFELAIVVLVAGEVVRYLVLWTFSRRQHLGFGRDDLALTILFGASIFGIRALSSSLGLTGGLGDLFPILQSVFRP